MHGRPIQEDGFQYDRLIIEARAVISFITAGFKERRQRGETGRIRDSVLHIKWQYRSQAGLAVIDSR